jgi:branched-chain amino acid transport system permease protein
VTTIAATTKVLLRESLARSCPQFAVDPLISVAIVLVTFLGGRATLWGPVIGAFIFEMAQQYLAYSLGGSQFYLIAYALVFLVAMLLMPRGTLPSIEDRLRRRRRRRLVDDSAPASPLTVIAGSLSHVLSASPRV